MSLPRRAFLAMLGAGLAGCGATTKRGSAGPRPVTATGHRGDVELLGALAQLKAQAAAVYGTGRGAPFNTLLVHERAHVDALTEAIKTAGGPPVAPAFGFTMSAGNLLEEARRLELSLVALGLDTLPKLADPTLRVLLTDLISIDAQHLATVELARHREPAPEAFLYGMNAL